MQGDDEQEAEGDGGAGAELRQLQPPAPQGTASGAQQLCRGLSGELMKTLLDSYYNHFYGVNDTCQLIFLLHSLFINYHMHDILRVFSLERTGRK